MSPATLGDRGVPADAARHVIDVFGAALAAVDPRAQVHAALSAGPLAGGAGVAGGAAARVTLVAVGKAAVPMAEGALAALGARVVRGLVITKSGHAAGHRLPAHVEVREAAHPVPDARSAAAAERVLDTVAAVAPDEHVVLCVSGGASALCCAPAAGVPWDDKLAACRALADAGAPITALNALRKHLSRVKGGRLLAAARAPVTVLVWSDVRGDDPAIVGGGLGAPDPSRFDDALAAGAHFGVSFPRSVDERLRAGAAGGAGAPDETPKPGDRRLAPHTVRVLAGNDDLVRAAAAACAAHGVSVPPDGVEPGVADPVASLAARLAARAAALAWRVAAGGPAVLGAVAGGEPTIVLPATPGAGGRCQHTALSVAARLAEMRLPAGVDVAVLAVGSDGTDGPTSAAGGLVGPATAARVVDLAGALARCDAGPALAAAGALVTTGPTGNNLGDLFLVCAARPSG